MAVAAPLYIYEQISFLVKATLCTLSQASLVIVYWQSLQNNSNMHVLLCIGFAKEKRPNSFEVFRHGFEKRDLLPTNQWKWCLRTKHVTPIVQVRIMKLGHVSPFFNQICWNVHLTPCYGLLVMLHYLSRESWN